jgi:hypothetical protein
MAKRSLDPVPKKVNAELGRRPPSLDECIEYVEDVLEIVDPNLNLQLQLPDPGNDKTSGRMIGGNIHDLLKILPKHLFLAPAEEYDNYQPTYSSGGNRELDILSLHAFQDRLAIILYNLEHWQFQGKFGNQPHPDYVDSSVVKENGVTIKFKAANRPTPPEGTTPRKRTLLLPSLDIVKRELQKEMPPYINGDAFGGSYPVVRIFSFNVDLRNLVLEDRARVSLAEPNEEAGSKGKEGPLHLGKVL